MQKPTRRRFLRSTGLGLAAAGFLPALGAFPDLNQPDMNPYFPDEGDSNLIGQYGAWAASRNGNRIPALSFRQPK